MRAILEKPAYQQQFLPSFFANRVSQKHEAYKTRGKNSFRFLVVDRATPVCLAFGSLSKTAILTRWQVSFTFGNSRLMINKLAKAKIRKGVGIFQADLATEVRNGRDTPPSTLPARFLKKLESWLHQGTALAQPVRGIFALA